MTTTEIYKPKHHVRFVTASSLFDGHDASINIMRRILQSTGAEVIHLGHNRSVEEVVNAAIQEDVQGIAISSYQGGHVEYFKYMHDLLQERGAPHIRIYGGGGGVILPKEIKDLHDYGIAWIFSPEDGRKMGLQGMINRMVEECDFLTEVEDESANLEKVGTDNPEVLANLITYAEEMYDKENPAAIELLNKARELSKHTPVLGITGTGGAGKSSLTDELIRRFLRELPDKKVAILSIDPTKQKTGGALLGDRIRMNAIFNKRVFMRSLATRGFALRIIGCHPRRARCRENGWLRFDHRRDERNRPRRCSNHGSVRRIDVRHDERVRCADTAREDRHDRLRRPHRHQ